MSIIQAWFDTLLRRMLESRDISALLPTGEETPTVHIDGLRAEIADVERRIAGLMLQRLDTPPAAQSVLTDLILRADEQLAMLRTTLDTALRQAIPKTSRATTWP
jgi:hypothetical protein